MDFRRRKLLVALGVMGLGMLLALAWHGMQGWVLGKGYPENTFLFKPEVRFSDFTDVLRLAAAPGVHNNYFPAAYLLFYPFLPFAPTVAALVFLSLCIVAVFALLYRALRHLIPHPGLRAAACVFFLWTYPVLYGLDRGNTEILLVFLIGLSLFFYARQDFRASFLCLLPAICFKLYPALLLLLFVRRSLLPWVFAGVGAFLALNLAVMLTYPGTLADNLSALRAQFTAYNVDYVMGWHGVSAAASAWNLFRICVWSGYSFAHGSWTWPLPDDVVLGAFQVYYWIFLAVLAIVTAFVLLVETSFARRAIVLLLYITVSAPGGGDYKLMHAEMALIILILLRVQRPGDLAAVIALALALVPKREVLLSFVGPSDSGYLDCSLNVILNPLCLLAAMSILIWNAPRPATPAQWAQRVKKLVSLLRLKEIVRLVAGPSRGRISPASHSPVQ